MTQSDMMMALPGPKAIVTLVPARLPIIALLSMTSKTLVLVVPPSGNR
jgi:hypothetical protein